MEDRPERNSLFDSPDIFGAVNHYVLLFFGMSCLLGSIFLQQIFMFINLTLIGISIASFGGIVLPIYLLTRPFAHDFRRQMRIHMPGAAMLVRVIIATVLIVVVIDFFYLLSQHLFPVPEEYMENLKELKPTGPGSFVLLLAGLCVIVPAAEEILFRGLFQQVFERNMGAVLAFCLTGILFGAAHFSAHLLVSVTLFGLFLSYLFYATGNLVYPIVAHGVFNLVSFLQLLSMDEESLMEPPFYTHQPWMFVTSLVIVIWLCVAIKKGSVRSGRPLE